MGSRLFFLLIDSGLVMGIGAYLLHPDVDSDRFHIKLLMFLSVLGLFVAAAVGVVRQFKKNIKSSKEQLESSEGTA